MIWHYGFMNPDSFVPVAPAAPSASLGTPPAYPFSGWLVWAVVFALALLLVGYGSILTYHWIQYSHTRRIAFVTTLIYFAGGAGLLLVMALAGMALIA